MQVFVTPGGSQLYTYWSIQADQLPYYWDEPISNDPFYTSYGGQYDPNGFQLVFGDTPRQDNGELAQGEYLQFDTQLVGFSTDNPDTPVQFVAAHAGFTWDSNSTVTGQGMATLQGFSYSDAGGPQATSGGIFNVQFKHAPATTSTVFSNLAALSITYGAVSATVSGHVTVNQGAELVPAGEIVRVTLEGVTQNVSLDSNENFSGTVNTTGLGVGDSPYAISFSYAGDGAFAPSSATSQLTVDAPLPGVESIVINGGAVQRSMVTRVTVTFNEQVTLSPGAFVVDKSGKDAEGLVVDQSVVNGDTVATLTFVGGDIIGGSLGDGRYTLTVNATDVQNQTGQAMASNASDVFWRLFGDVRGTGSVDALDYQMLLTAERTQTMLGFFDYYGTGQLNMADLAQFLLRFGKHA
jgi:hypothetical protein